MKTPSSTNETTMRLTKNFLLTVRRKDNKHTINWKYLGNRWKKTRNQETVMKKTRDAHEALMKNINRSRNVQEIV